MRRSRTVRGGRIFRRAGLMMALAVAGEAGADEGKLECVYGEGGLNRLAWSGVDLLKDGRPAIKKMVFEREAPDGKGGTTYSFERVDGAAPKVSFDRAGRRWTYGYPWGSVSIAYAPGSDRLGITVGISNESKLPVADFEIRPLVLHFPAPPSKPEQGRWMEALPDHPGIIEAHFGTGKLLLCGETLQPLNVGLTPGGKPESAVAASGGVPMMEPGGVHYPRLGLPRVPPGKTLTFTLSLRFSSVPASRRWAGEPANQGLIADRIEAFRKYHQPRLSWKDRRPIGTIFLGQGKGPENNPRFWFKRQDLDVRTPEGKAELRRLFMEFADRCIASLRKTNAQGMIVWDPEGAENPHPVTYIGDPRMVKLLAPEAEDIYPAFFKKFLEAGLRTGCCLRPTQVYREKDGKWSHGTGSHGPERNPLGDDFANLWPQGLPWWRFYPVVERLCRKIEYAKKNWGCTIFYVDTNGVHRQIGEKQEFKWALLDSHVWRDVLRRHPDVLLIPELSTGAPAAWAYVAQYLQPPYSAAATPAPIQELFPGAFSVCQSVNLSPADWDRRRHELLEGLRRGDSFFFRGWFDCGYNAKIRQMVDEVYKPGAVNPGLPESPAGAPK